MTKTIDFCKVFDACPEGRDWALSVGEDMADVWDRLISESRYDWLRWVLNKPGVLPDKQLRLLACRFVRETPIGGGKTVWDLLTDERSRNAVVIAERFANGDATAEELEEAYTAAYAAHVDVYAAANAAAAAAAADAADVAYAAYAADVAYAAYAAADADAADVAYAAYAAAGTAQVKMIAELGNPFHRTGIMCLQEIGDGHDVVFKERK